MFSACDAYMVTSYEDKLAVHGEVVLYVDKKRLVFAVIYKLVFEGELLMKFDLVGNTPAVTILAPKYKLHPPVEVEVYCV